MSEPETDTSPPWEHTTTPGRGCWCDPDVVHVGASRAATASMPEWRQVAEDMALLVQILWAGYPMIMSPGQMGAFIDSLPDDLQYALMAATGQTHKGTSWESPHPTCGLIRSLNEEAER